MVFIMFALDGRTSDCAIAKFFSHHILMHLSIVCSYSIVQLQ